MPELKEYKATITVGDAEYSFDRPHIETEDNRMAISMFLTFRPTEVADDLAEALVENDVVIDTVADNGEDFLALHTESRELDYEVMENVLQVVIDNHDTVPEYYQIVAAESPWGAHVALVTLW